MSTKSRTIAFCAALTVAICAMVFGVLRGEMDVVLAKAVAVCLECMGIG